MWEVNISQRVQVGKGEGFYNENLKCEFEKFSDARTLAELILKGAKNVTVELVWKETNIESEGEK